MPDKIPATFWLLIVIAAAAWGPALYLYRHVSASPRHHDITQPPVDLSWRSSSQFWRSTFLIVGLSALAVFIFTPTAEQFGRSRAFPPTLMLTLSACATFYAAEGLRKGRIQPLIRGFSNYYERAAQPKRFWASLFWNIALVFIGIWAAFQMITDWNKDECYDARSVYTPQEGISACNELIDQTGISKGERALALAYRGYAYQRGGDLQHALLDYSQAIALNPRDAVSLYNRGTLYERLGDKRSAIRDYGESLRWWPENASAHFNRGLIFLETGKLDEAAADFTRAHELNPKDPWALANRGIAYAWKNDRTRAERDFEAVKSFDRSNPVLLRGEALLHLQAGERRAAIDKLTEALRVDPKDKWSLRARADAYWELGEREKAQADDDRLGQLVEEERSASSPER